MRFCARRSGLLAVLFAWAMALSARATAQAQADLTPREPQADELFPGAFRGAVAVATGLPFVAMGELSVGLSDNFALGALVGVTPRVYAVGGRPRVLLFDRPDFRISVVMPVLYYPKTHSLGGAPWLLARPSLLITPRLSPRVQLPCGIGLVGAATIARLARARGVDDYSDGAGGARGYDSERPVTAGLWWTVAAGVSVALSPRITLFGELALVLERLGLASAAWVGGPPVILTAGLSTRI